MRTLSRSRARDALVDATLTALALAIGLSSNHSLLRGIDGFPVWLRVADLVLGCGGFIALWWRRERPVVFACYVLIVSAFTTLSGGLVLVATFTLAVYRRWPTAVAFAALFVASAGPGLMLYNDHGPWLSEGSVAAVVVIFAFTGWGMFVRARRQLVAALLTQIDHARADRGAAIEHARAAERRAIARELHDVLAHRLSVLGVHAGALEFRPDAPPDQIAGAARLIRETVHEGLEELRTAIRVLRDAPDDSRAPLPALTDIPALADRAREAGVRVDVDLDRVRPENVSPQCGRAAYRLVQEGLTNVRKHAPGATASVLVAEEGNGQLTIRIRNTRPHCWAAAAQQGSHSGLIGLGERVGILGGILRHGTTDDGGYLLEATLPLHRPAVVWS
ncbi:sensor histidine kinase [Nocardia sp. CA-135398]|uniref:sensor histidine kinase n=1 Tax=Nocardia sp. CA-135398 TaxID=3239977 RepID=UPI003D96BA9D